MARLVNPPFSSSTSASTMATDPLQDLTRLLARLEQNILRASDERTRRLAADEFLRARARSSVEAARDTLTRLERDALSIKAAARRQEVQAALSRRREVVERLRERLQDLEEEGEEEAGGGVERGGEGGEEGDEGDSSEEGDDLLAEIIETPSESMDSRSTGVATSDIAAGERERERGGLEREEEDDEEGQEREPIIRDASTRPPEAELAVQEPADEETDEDAVPADGSRTAEKMPQPSTTTTTTTTTSQTLRPRGGHQPQQDTNDTAKTTSASLFEGRRHSGSSVSAPKPAPSHPPATATEEALLDSHRAEQEALSDDILRLARALKERSVATAQLLDQDREVLGRVGDGLHRTDRGMASASRRMGALARMTEGKGFFGRVLLFAMVYGMMVVLVLMFLFLPKLRF